MPHGYKTDTPLARAEPISSSSNASGKTELRRGKKPLCNRNCIRRSENMERNKCAYTKVSGERGVGGPPGAGVEVPLQPVVQTMMTQLCLCNPWRSVVEQRSTCMPWRTPCQSRRIPKGVGSPHWLLAGPVAPWREKPMLEQVCWQDL
ncbi:hypothetical protein BTVI_56553 [Pitangus sulphuratus]|nr:hypothetical protein BTVI_56553 [Pitangus sulphuratus]